MRIKIFIIQILILGNMISWASQNPFMETDFFSQAVPIWPEGFQDTKNITIGFHTQFNQPLSQEASLMITGSSLYRIYVNGSFAGHGPARAGHGYYRVDKWDLKEYLHPGTNYLAIEVVSYNVNSYYLLDQPPFIQAEIFSGTKVLSATSPHNEDFRAYHLTERLQKVPRYSFHRPFVECYMIEPDYDAWRTQSVTPNDKLICTQTTSKNLIPRRISYPNFKIIHPVRQISTGTLRTGIANEKYWKDRAVVNIGKKLGGFPEAELELNPAIELQEMKNITLIPQTQNYNKNILYNFKPEEFRIFDLGTNLTGFIGMEIEVIQPGRFFLTFDEILSENDVDFKRLGCINAVTYDLEPGKYQLESFEPYTLRYLKIISAQGAAQVKNLYLREYANPDTDRSFFTCSDLRLNRIFQAGVETFRQNAVDIFMDCPSRERAGWLCDSYFTARVAQDLSGNALI